jgi:hypothetical protein
VINSEKYCEKLNILHINRIAPRAYYIPYADEASAFNHFLFEPSGQLQDQLRSVFSLSVLNHVPFHVR